MRLLIILIVSTFLFAFCTKEFPAPIFKPKWDKTYTSPSDTNLLIIVWGESNNAGNAPNDSALRSEVGSRPEIQIWNEVTHKYENLFIGAPSANNQQFGGIDTSRHGPELGAANEVDSGKLPNPTYMVKIAVSGARIAYFLKDSPLNYWNTVVPYAKEAYTAMAALGKPFKCVVWCSMGGNDWLHVPATPIPTFVNEYLLFISQFRTLIGDPNLKFLNLNYNSIYAYYYPQNVYKTEIDSLAAVTPTTFYSLNGDSLTMNADLAHWNYYGQKRSAYTYTISIPYPSNPSPPPPATRTYFLSRKFAAVK